jgi:hypothetical protein
VSSVGCWRWVSGCVAIPGGATPVFKWFSGWWRKWLVPPSYAETLPEKRLCCEATQWFDGVSGVVLRLHKPIIAYTVLPVGFSSTLIFRSP